MNSQYDVVIIGAGAAGLFCAYNTALRNKRVLVLDHANKVGKKILMSGGGRCNFTNLYTSHEDFTSENPHFCKSALNQYSPYEFLALVEKHGIEYVEKAAGQLFCKHSSKDILKMLLDECAAASVKIYKKCSIEKIEAVDDFNLKTTCGEFSAKSLVVATGGLSIPSLGATGFGYEIAEKFGHEIVKTSASLVPFTFSENQLETIHGLSGVALPVSAKCRAGKQEIKIDDDLLFTHRGLSGPVILKLSAYWKFASEVEIDLLPGKNIVNYIAEQIVIHGDQLFINNIAQLISKKIAAFICGEEYRHCKLKQLNKRDIELLENRIHHWIFVPSGTEGYKTAEVTAGGINTEQVSSKTCESKLKENLYFIGEVLDVTGQLGGYNFQWAWASAWCAANSIR